MVEIELTENIHVLIGGTFPYCNTIVLLGEQITIIDPGCPIDLLTSYLRKRSLELRNIDAVVLSHIHPDHITFASRIQRLSKCRIIANEITASLYNEKEQMKDFLGFHISHPIRPFWEDLVNKRMFGALDTDSQVDYVLGKNEKYDAGGIMLTPIMTPGHLPDHMCIEFPDEDLIFSADIDCTPFGPYYGHPNSSIPEFKESIALLQAKECKGLISGHLTEPLITEYKAELNSYKLQFDLREDFVMMAISQGAGTIDEISANPIIYRSLSNLVFLQFEKWMIGHHITSLLEKEFIRLDQNRYVREKA